jgi:hypothetical protein
MGKRFARKRLTTKDTKAHEGFSVSFVILRVLRG